MSCTFTAQHLTREIAMKFQGSRQRRSLQHISDQLSLDAVKALASSIMTQPRHQPGRKRTKGGYESCVPE